MKSCILYTPAVPCQRHTLSFSHSIFLWLCLSTRLTQCVLAQAGLLPEMELHPCYEAEKRSPERGLDRLYRSMLAAVLNQLFQVFAGIHDMPPNGVRRGNRVPRPADIQKFPVRFARAAQVARHDQMEPRVAVTLHV